MTGDFGGPLARVPITPEMRSRALADAEARADHTSRRQDFHAGGRANVVEKFWIGNLGEEVFGAWATSWGIAFRRRSNPVDRADDWDFELTMPSQGLRTCDESAVIGKIDVKTRSHWTKPRLLVRDDRVRHAPCNAYVVIAIEGPPATARFGLVEGWATRADVESAHLEDSVPSADGRTQKNRVIEIDDLRPLIELVELVDRPAVDGAAPPR